LLPVNRSRAAGRRVLNQHLLGGASADESELPVVQWRDRRQSRDS